MGCINANIGSKGGCLSAKICRIGNGIDVNIGLVNEHLVASINVIGVRLKAHIGLICTPNTDAYIKVSPAILWFFTANETKDVNVTSNIQWIVK